METKKDRAIYIYIRNIKGLSIIELMLGIFLSSLILFASLDVLSSQDKVFNNQYDISGAQHNIRIAMKRLSNDLMAAGFGRPSWTTINGNSGLDFSVRYSGGNLDVVGCLGAPSGYLANSVSAGATTIMLKTGNGSNFNTTSRSDIKIGDGENAKILSISGDTLTIDADPTLSGTQALSYTYNANAEVYLVRWVTYAIDNSNTSKPVLKIDEHQGAGTQTIAEYVDSMSVSISGNIVDLTLTGRTKNPSKTTGQYVLSEMANKIVMRNIK
jgi:Tfp pilus assembly protein PilW